MFLNVSSSSLSDRIHNCTGCICLTLIHRVFSNVSSNCLPKMMQSHIGCICLTFSSVVRGSGPAKEHWLQLFHFPLCLIKCFFKPLAVCSLMSFQIAYFGGCIMTLYGTCWTFSDCVLMCFQLASLGGRKVTLTAFVCLFSTVGFKCPQILPLSL